MYHGVARLAIVVLGLAALVSSSFAQTRVGNTAIGFNVDFNTYSAGVGSGTMVNFTGSGSLTQYVNKNLALSASVGSAVTPVGPSQVNAVTTVGLGLEIDFTPRRARAMVPFIEVGGTANYSWTPPVTTTLPGGDTIESGGLSVSNGFMFGGGFKAFVSEHASINTSYRLRSISSEGSSRNTNITNLSTGLQIYF